MSLTKNLERQKPRYKIRGGLHFPLNPQNQFLVEQAQERGLSVFVDMAHETAASSVRAGRRTTPANARAIYNRSFRAAIEALTGGPSMNDARIDARFAEADSR